MSESAKTLCGHGGCAGPDFCPKHRVPMIRTTGGESLCAVCERAERKHLQRKIDHGCIDFFKCHTCDKAKA